MEYLMTYGWALLVIVIVIAILLIMNPFASPQTCKFDTVGFACDNIAVRADTQYMAGSILNGNNNAVDIYSVTCLKSSAPQPAAPAAAAAKIDTLGRQGAFAFNVTAGTSHSIQCPDASQTSGTDFSGKIWVYYKNAGESADYPYRVTSANIMTKVLGSGSAESITEGDDTLAPIRPVKINETGNDTNKSTIYKSLNVSASPSKSGSVLGSAYSFIAPPTMAISASPAKGYAFSNWVASGNCNVTNASSANTTVNVISGSCQVIGYFNYTNITPNVTIISYQALAADSYRVATSFGDVSCGATSAQDWSYKNAKMIKVSANNAVFGGPNDTISGDYTFSSVLVDNVGRTNAGTSLNGTYYASGSPASWSPRVFWKVPGRDCYNWNYITSPQAGQVDYANLGQDTWRVATQAGDVACGATSAQDWSYQNAKFTKLVSPSQIFGGTGDQLSGSYTMDNVMLDIVGLANNGSTSLNGNFYNQGSPSAWAPRVFWKAAGRDCWNWNNLGNPITIIENDIDK